MKERGCRMRIFSRLVGGLGVLAGMVLAAAAAGAAEGQPSDGRVPFIRPKPDWDRFVILVWQYQTRAQDDLELYKQAGFHGFHIDRGAGAQAQVDFAREAGFPYYVDHAADKGYLYLSSDANRSAVSRKKTVIPRPNSLADPKTIEILQGHLRKNVAVTKQGPVLAYAFDDEISLGVFNSPAEVDGSELSVAGYRAWLKATYGSIEKLNAQWGTALKDFSEAQPCSFEELRAAHAAPPFAKWNLSRWMDWRSYMDAQFADCLANLSRFTNTLDPATPAGFVGGQQPAPYGGYDYSKITKSIQWIEAYDIGGTCEILRSLWKWPERRPYVQTWFSTGDPKRDAWFLWYYLVHGCRGVIAWPDRGGSWFHYKGGGLAPFIAANAATIREVQGEVSKFILDPDTRFDADPIALYHSHPSVQASWVMDVVPHGGTWPNRSSSMDNANSSSGRNRVAWMKLLEDCGYQYNVVTPEQVTAGVLQKEGYKVLILGRTICMSDAEAAAIRRFVEQGGTVIADYLTGVLDEHGKGRPQGALDDLFGIKRDESKGYLDGKTIAEINGELYQRPFLQRLSYDGALRIKEMSVYERGTRDVGGELTAACVGPRDIGNGHATYLNLTPVVYTDLGERLGNVGRLWYSYAGTLIQTAGARRRARLCSGGEDVPLTETLFWRKGDTVVLAVIKNPPREAAVDSAGKIEDVFGQPIDVEVKLARPATAIRNLRTGEKLPDGAVIKARWQPWEALLFEMKWP
jgi:hypothetical protein